MPQKNPFDQFDSMAQPVPVQQIAPLQPILTDPNKAREAQLREEEAMRDQTRTDIQVRGEQVQAEERQLSRFDTYRKEFLADPTVRQFKEVENATKQIVELAQRKDDRPGATDIALIISFMKALDPGSVVRETEFATAENAGGVPETIRNAYNKLVSGGRLTPEIKREFASTATSIYNARRGGYNTFAETYRGLVQEAGGDPDKQGIRLAEPIEFQATSPLATPNQTRTAAEGESFLTTEQQQLLARFTQAYDAGASLEELRSIAPGLPFATQEELDAARRSGRRPTITPMGRDPRADMGVLEGAVETVTGSQRSTPEVEALPDAMSMPELNSASGQSFLAGLGTMVTGPQETVQVIQAQFPGVQVRQDEKGNFILRSSMDGQEYAIKPGFRVSDIPRAIGSVLAFTPAGRATTAGGAMVSGGLTQVGIEATQAATGGQFNAEEVLLAGAGNVAGQQLGRVVNAVRGPTPPTGPRVIRNAEEVIQAGQREGVPVMTSDVAPPTTWAGRWLQQAGEKLPFVGTAGQRGEQQQARVAMIEKLADDYGTDTASIDAVTEDFMRTRGDAIAKNTQQKREVFGALAGGPPPETTAAIEVLDNAIANIGDQGTFAPLLAKLRTWRTDLANARDINDVERLRKAVGDVFDDESLKSLSTELRAVVKGENGLYDAINRDMGEYIKANGGGQAFAKWRAANDELSGLAGDLENTTLKRVLARGEATPEEAASLLFSKKPSEVEALFRNLSPAGKERARSVVVAKLLEDAGGVGQISTANFTRALQKAQKTYGVAFRAEDVSRFNGMLRLLENTRRAERAADVLPTGQQLLPFAALTSGGVLANVLGGWGATAAVGAASLAGFRAFESKAMRNLLVSLGKTKPGSKAETNVLGMIAKAMPAASAQAVTPDQPTSVIEVR